MRKRLSGHSRVWALTRACVSRGKLLCALAGCGGVVATQPPVVEVAELPPPAAVESIWTCGPGCFITITEKKLKPSGTMTVVAARTATGTLWVARVPFSAQSHVGDTHVALLGPGGLATVEKATGAMLTRKTTEPMAFPALEIHDDQVVIASALGVARGLVEAYGVESLDLRWSRSLHFEHHGPMAVVDDTLWLGTQGGVLFALDPESGHDRVSWGFGADFWFERSITGNPVVTTRAGTQGPVQAYRRWRAFEALEISGKILTAKCGEVANVAVMINDAYLKVDTAGAFRTSLEARGALRVQIVGSVGGEHRIVLDGSRHYVVPPLHADFCKYR